MPKRTAMVATISFLLMIGFALPSDAAWTRYCNTYRTFRFDTMTGDTKLVTISETYASGDAHIHDVQWKKDVGVGGFGSQNTFDYVISGSTVTLDIWVTNGFTGDQAIFNFVRLNSPC